MRKNKSIMFWFYTLICLAVTYLVQGTVFKRVDYDLLILIFVLAIHNVRFVRIFIVDWFLKLALVYCFSILAYLLILYINTHVYQYDAMNVWRTYFQLFVMVPFLSMAPLFFILQSIWFLFDKQSVNGEQEEARLTQ